MPAQEHEYLVETPDGTQVTVTTIHHHGVFDSLKEWYLHHKPLVYKAIVKIGGNALHEFGDVKIWKKVGVQFTKLK